MTEETIKRMAEMRREIFRCNVFADAFVTCDKLGYDIYDFSKKVMTDDELDYLFITDDIYEWVCGEYFFDYILRNYGVKKAKVKKDDRFLMWFTGYLYRYWMINYNIDRRDIWKMLPFKEFENRFAFYHTQGWDYIVEDATKMYEDKLREKREKREKRKTLKSRQEEF